MPHVQAQKGMLRTYPWPACDVQELTTYHYQRSNVTRKNQSVANVIKANGLASGQVRMTRDRPEFPVDPMPQHVMPAKRKRYVVMEEMTL